MTFAPTRVLMVLAVHAMMPPMKPHAVTPIKIHRLPNLSEMRPNKMMEMALATDQMIEKRLALSLGPVSRA